MLEQLSTVIIHLIQATGYFGIFILMTLESLLIPIPSEITMPFAGFLASKGQLSFLFVVLAGTVGNVVGSLIAYKIGYYLEETIVLSLIEKYGKFILVSKHEYEVSLKWLKTHGQIVVLTSRILPGVRTFISLPAGMSKINLPKFLLYTFVGSFIWSFLLTYIGFYLGTKWHTIGVYFRRFDIVIVVLLILTIFVYINHKLKLVKF